MEDRLECDVVLLTSALKAHGWTSSQIRRSVVAGDLVPVRHGAYRFRQDAVDEVTGHRYRALAAAAVNAEVAISHVSAVAVHGLPLWQAELSTVHLMRLGAGHGGRVAGVHFHQPVPAVVPGSVAQAPVVQIADALVQFGLTLPKGAELTWRVAGDAALAGRQTTADEVSQALRRHAGRTGISRARWLAGLLDTRHESPGETRLAGSLERLRIASTPQVEFKVADRIYRVDRLLDQDPVVVEFDGAIKYRQGSLEEGRRALIEEKRREDALRSAGLEFVRVDWQQVGDLDWLDRQITAAQRRAHRSR